MVGFSIAVFGVIHVTIVNTIDNELAQQSSLLIQNIGVISNENLDALDIDFIPQSEEVLHIAGLSIQVWQTHDGALNITPKLIQSSLNVIYMTTALDPSSLAVSSPTFSHVTINSARERVITHPIVANSGQQIGIIQIASSIVIIDQMTAGILVIMIVGTMIGVIISIGLNMLLSYFALQPMQKITAAAVSISTTDDLKTRLPKNMSDNELGQLTEAFNHMMARLERLFGVQQRFVTDLSHELRTPLTTIQGNLDIIQRYGSDEASIQAIRLETNRLIRMVNEVLILARADYGGIEMDLHPFDINDTLALDSCERISTITQPQKHNLSLDKHHQSVYIKGNYEYLHQAICNLLLNAIRFTQDDEAIRVSIYQRGQRGIIEVADRGIGISQENIDRIFDPFYRVDNSRTHTSDQDGAGLGLSIVKWIVEAHHGKIEVKSEINIGTTVRIILPLLKECPQSCNSDNQSLLHSKTISSIYNRNY
jgi:signal transduction histidine kinase